MSPSRTAIALCLVSSLASATSVTARAARGSSISTTHVRLGTRALASLASDAARWSPTLRSIMNVLEASDVYVYVNLEPRIQSGLGGGITFVGAGIGVRYLRISLNASNVADEMVMMLAHELQHAVEIAKAPEVRNVDAFKRYYARVGIRARFNTGWDTNAAREAALAVRRELSMRART
jgi:hypothetical protein